MHLSVVSVLALTTSTGMHATRTAKHHQVKSKNLFATLMVRMYVWIVPNWNLQQSMAKSMEHQVQQIAYQSKLYTEALRLDQLPLRARTSAHKWQE